MSRQAKPKKRLSISNPPTLRWSNFRRLTSVFSRSKTDQARIEHHTDLQLTTSTTSPITASVLQLSAHLSTLNPPECISLSDRSTICSPVLPLVPSGPSGTLALPEAPKNVDPEEPAEDLPIITIVEPTEAPNIIPTVAATPSFPGTISLLSPSLDGPEELVPFSVHPVHRDLGHIISAPTSNPIYTGSYSRVYIKQCGTETFAIKVLGAVGTLPAIRRRYRREVLTASRLNHPNILRVLGVIEADWCQFGCIITQWYPNGDAALYIHRPDIDYSKRYELFRSVACGLEYLHNESIVHGDLKPNNILIDEGGNPILCDFGLARILDELTREKEDKINTTTMHTGTPRYLAFELVEPDTPAELTTASDIHALGCVGYEFLSLTLPYASRLNNTAGHIFRDIAKGIPPACRPPIDLPLREAALWDLLQSCWNKTREMRPTISNVRDTLEMLME